MDKLYDGSNITLYDFDNIFSLERIKMKLKFKNGNVIEIIEVPDNIVRGKRSELIGFYCKHCDCIHEDYFLKDTIIIDNDIYCNRVLEEN